MLTAKEVSSLVAPRPSARTFACGHPKTKENQRMGSTWYHPKTPGEKSVRYQYWRCKICHNEQNARWYEKRKK